MQEEVVSKKRNDLFCFQIKPSQLASIKVFILKSKLF